MSTEEKIERARAVAVEGFETTMDYALKVHAAISAARRRT